MSESHIIAACKNGDYSRFGALYDSYIRRIYDFVYYKTHHKETAEDLTSVTWTKAIERIRSYDESKGSFSSWLYKIAQNTVIDHYRTRKEEKNIDDAWDLPSSSHVARDVENKLAIEQLREHMAAFTSEQRDILVMRLWQGMTYKEIADITGKSEASSKMVVSRCLAKLRQSMPLGAYLLLLAGLIK